MDPRERHTTHRADRPNVAKNTDDAGFTGSLASRSSVSRLRSPVSRLSLSRLSVSRRPHGRRRMPSATLFMTLGAATLLIAVSLGACRGTPERTNEGTESAGNAPSPESASERTSSGADDEGDRPAPSSDATTAHGGLGAACDDARPCAEALACPPRPRDGARYCAPPGLQVVHGGTFTMGSPLDEVGRADDHREREREVTLTRTILVQSTEISQGAWAEVMGSNPAFGHACGDPCPVERVSWFDALAYLNTRSEREGLETCYDLSACHGVPGGSCPEEDAMVCAGTYLCDGVGFVGLDCRGYRLPTEAEWEYFARAGSRDAIYDDRDSAAWNASNSIDQTHPAGAKYPNDFGLYDTLGHVWEWTWDPYEERRPEGPLTDPVSETDTTVRTIRGGSFADTENVRAAARAYATPDTRSGYIGLRPVRTILSEPEP